jgi:predicted esterase
MNDLRIHKTARYATFGQPEIAETVWIVLHGYGQLAEYFIRKFHCLDPTKNFVIAPEGMHRFYLEGSSGRVGASWMTKEAREADIADNMEFLNQLWDTITQQYHYTNKVLLGFSQGGATAARWHELGNYEATYFVLWASVFPPDLQFEPTKNAFVHSKNYFVLGNDDPYYTLSKRTEMTASIAPLGFDHLSFEGKHTIHSETLQRIEQDIIDV